MIETLNIPSARDRFVDELLRSVEQRQVTDFIGGPHYEVTGTPANTVFVLTTQGMDYQSASLSRIQVNEVTLTPAVLPGVTRILRSTVNVGNQDGTFFFALATVQDDSILFVPERTPTRLESLAREFDASLSLLQAVWRVLNSFADERTHLTLSVERMVDPESGKPLEIVFDLQGTQSVDETDQVWEELERAFAESIPKADWHDFVSKIGIHVRRGKA